MALASKKYFSKVTLLLLLVFCFVLVLCLMFGSSFITWQNWQQSALIEQIVMLRFNRAMHAFSVGMLLALSGLMMQVLLKNPLADPYILGVSGGASVGALIAISFGFGLFALNVSAFIGAIVSILIVFQLGIKNNHYGVHLILLGVILSLIYAGVVNLMLIFSSDAKLKSMIFWLMGDLSTIDFNSTALIVAVFILLSTTLLANKMNLLMLGELKAQTLGIDLKQSKLMLYVLASIATAIAITSSGVIGFVGLIVPHALRFLKITDHRLLTICTGLVGGIFLMVADLLSRTLFAPTQLPVGLMTTLIGAPIFIYLLRR